jgi:glutamyl-tRNA synthetase
LKVRVRFAPSPTGYLHIGGVRTALFNWLFARHHNGQFILRVEDTDRDRSTDESIKAIIDGLTWLGLTWDEGPYRQTERFDIYSSRVDRLIKEGHAYFCYCSQQELEKRRKEAMKKGMPLRYDRRCRDLKGVPPHDKPTLRFKIPLEGQIKVNDLIRGEVIFENSQLDDFIILRADGTPTYNFVVVVDDIDMDITHIIRGDDHLTNTPRQIHLYQALGHEPPQFAHLPMILGPDKTRLSKRHGAMSVTAYHDMGYLPQSLINYLVRLGWSYGDQEVFSRDELIEKFTLDNVGKAAAVFNPEKLLWLNSVYIKETPSHELIDIVKPFLIREGVVNENSQFDTQWLAQAIDTLKERSKDLIELVQQLRYYLSDNITYAPQAQKKFLNEKTLPYLKAVKEKLSLLSSFTHSSLEEAFLKVMEKEKVKLGKIAQPVRVAMTGGTASPGIFEVLEIVGKERTIQRLEQAIRTITGQ